MSRSDAGFLTIRLSYGQEKRAVRAAGIGDERAILRDARVLLVPDRVLVERAGRQVVMDLSDIEVILGKAECFHDRHR